MQVLIVGAGIGGACLAHGLRKHGIRVTVWERSAAKLAGLPGYGIHINSFGQQALEECIPHPNWCEFNKRAKAVGGEVRFFDERLRLLANVPGHMVVNNQTRPERRLSISRAELRDILLAGLQAQRPDLGPVVHWRKEFSHYEVVEDERIRAYCTDGSYTDVDILVGADGSNSRVRQQYLPQIQRFRVGATAIVGRTRLTAEMSASLPAILTDGAPNSIVARSPDWMFVSVWRAPVDVTVDTNQAEIDSYVVWAYIAEESSFPPDLVEMPPTDLSDLVLVRIAKWNLSLHEVVRKTELASLSALFLRSMPNLPPWSPSRVVLVGDSIHNMTPMAGVGANTALRDAQLLAAALARAADGRDDLMKALADYERTMRAYANDAVALSLRNAQNAVSPSGLKRFIFRKILRLSQIMPATKRVLFPASR